MKYNIDDDQYSIHYIAAFKTRKDMSGLHGK